MHLLKHLGNQLQCSLFPYDVILSTCCAFRFSSSSDLGLFIGALSDSLCSTKCLGRRCRETHMGDVWRHLSYFREIHEGRGDVEVPNIGGPISKIIKKLKIPT